MVGVLSLGMLTQPRLRGWLALCGLVSVWYGVEAIDRVGITASFNRSASGTGSWAWWGAYLAFHHAAWYSFGSFSIGLIGVGIAALRGERRSPAHPDAGLPQAEYR